MCYVMIWGSPAPRLDAATGSVGPVPYYWMADQSDLVIALAEFQPKIVKMDSGKKPRYRGKKRGHRDKGKRKGRRR